MMLVYKQFVVISGEHQLLVLHNFSLSPSQCDEDELLVSKALAV